MKIIYWSKTDHVKYKVSYYIFKNNLNRILIKYKIVWPNSTLSKNLVSMRFNYLFNNIRIYCNYFLSNY